MTRALALLLLPLVLALGMSLRAEPTFAQEAPEPPAVVSPTPAPPAPEPIGNPAPDRTGGLGGLLPDPRQWAAEVFNQVIVWMLQGIASALRAVVGGVMSSSLNFITQTPPGGSYASPTVVALWQAVRGISNAGLVLVALWGGVTLIVHAQAGEPYHEAMELLPRLALGGLLVNTSLWWAQLAIDANNALCSAIGQTSLPAWERADGFSQALMDVIAGLIYLVTSLLLLLQMLMRLALIDVLIVVSPVGLLCWVLPQTQGWSRLWSHTFTATVFTQFVQVLTLKLGGSLLTELTPMAPSAAVLALFLGVAVLAMTLKVPGLMRAHVGDGLGFARYFVYRQVSHGLEGRAAGAGKGGK